MTREELTNSFLSSSSTNFILQLPTSYGKSKMALQKIQQWYTPSCKILIIIPRLVLIDNWKEEIKKWKMDKLLDNIVFTTYISIHKHAIPSKYWDAVIFDEGHHTSERCRELLIGLNAKHIIVLSATLKREHIDFFKFRFRTEIIKINVRDAIESNVLPDPKIILIPMELDNRTYNCVIKKNITRNTRPRDIVEVSYNNRWAYRNTKKPHKIWCTPQQYYDDISSLVIWYKNKAADSYVMRNLWLHKAGERLKWLAEQKESIVKNLLKQLKNYRVLTFCQSIKQSETLGCPCVNSKIGTENLEKFNAKKIKHIASIDMLNEGLNPIDCKIGLFQMINSSQRISLQRIGRILRHKEPVLIFPYWKYTREEEILKKLLQDYNPELVSTLDLKEIGNIKNYI